MPNTVTRFSGLRDHIDDDARSHNGRGVDVRMVSVLACRPLCRGDSHRRLRLDAGKWVSLRLSGADEF
jgi:hypothetical protein